ncbi:MAG: DedA family protein [Spirochaetes bacterium]|nr:DedA family protein [Spirochaetota bacterium]
MLQSLITVFLEFGYFAVFGVLILCGLGIPIPEDISLISGGVIAGLGYANPYVMTAVSMTGVLIGDTSMFYIGHHLGNRFLNGRFVRRIVTPARYRTILEWFDRYGKTVLFAARFMPGLRAAIFLSAGITRFVRYPVFILIDTIAAFISVPLWIYLGYYGASNWEWLKRIITKSHVAILVAVVLFIAILSIHTFFRYKVKKIEKQFSGSITSREGME